MKTIAFLAQNLDNTSPNHIEIDGIPLMPNAPQRQEITKLVSKVSLNGRKEIERNGFSLYVLRSEFVIKAIPLEKDNVGRLAPIICYGRFPQSPSDSWAIDLTKNFERFAKGISRNFPEGMLADILSVMRQEMLNTDLKKTILPMLATILLALAIGYAIYLLIFQKR